jgi:cytochrome c551/c552
MTEMSQLQRQLLGGGGGVTLFTQQEFDDALAIAKAEIMAMAIEASRTAVMMEREACAKIVEDWSVKTIDPSLTEIAEIIRNRIPSQRN